MKLIVQVIVLFVFAAAIVFTALGVYDFLHAFSHFSMEKRELGLLAVGLLQSIDLFLMAMVLFVFALGVQVLFNSKPLEGVPLPKWLQIQNFTELKVILWEAILTTMVIAYVASMVQKRGEGETLNYTHLVLPASIMLLAMSLFFMKKGGEHH